ncbi:RICIN domain-containing protein [Streptomyces sp. NPDC001744]|uniref:RICIN domain-containing protein n=1 Tax=Streptomyces sp. NPDC001744 TaxID=3364606 RepID=UPI0036D1EF42
MTKGINVLKTLTRNKAFLATAVAAAGVITAVTPDASSATTSASVRGASAAQAAPIPGIHYLRPVSAPGKCVTVHGWSSRNGGVIDQWTCQKQKNQRWNLIPQNFRYWVKSESSNKCLDALDLKKGRKVTQWTCHPGLNQEWHPVRKGNAYEIVVQGLCLDVEGGSTANGARLLLWKCNGRKNQRFYLN